MANLLAHVRSQSGIAPRDPERLLGHVNRMMWKSTAANHYATLFLGIYDDDTRRLNYVNCGHNPPMWLHADGTVDRLGPTATVIGLFPDWHCSAVEVELRPGDLLAVFSDGVTEAEHGTDEFGEERLIDELRGNRRLPPDEIVSVILNSVQAFSRGALSDDLTLLVAQA